MTPTELLDIATEAALGAGKLLVAKLDEVRSVGFKGPGRNNLVTDADTASEAVILEVLRRRAPGHAICAEESGSSGTSPFTWFIDPLDGTTNYAHAVPHFCVTLGVEGPWEGTTQLLAGVILDPLRNELFAAARGAGATLNGKAIHVSPVTSLENALMCTGFPYDVQKNPTAPLGLFDRIVRRAQGIRRMGSAALDLAYVACGRFDGYFEFGLKPWDIAAGALLVAEAGGVFSRVDGAPLDVRCGDVLAAPTELHASLALETKKFVEGIGWSPKRFEG